MRKWRCIISLQCSGGRHSSQCPRELTKPVVHGLRRTAGDFMYVDLHLAGGEVPAISRDPRRPYLSSWRSDLCATGHSTLSSCIILKTRCLCTVKFYNLFADMNYTTQLTFKQTLWYRWYIFLVFGRTKHRIYNTGKSGSLQLLPITQILNQ